MTRRRTGRSYLRRATALVAVSLVVAACSQTTTQGADGVDTLEDVYAAVAGLTGQARYDKLLELAEAENAAVELYAVGNTDPLTEAFTDGTGIEVNVFNANSEQLAERVLSENSANRVGSDVLIGSPNDLDPLSKMGVLAKLDTPVLQDLDPSFYSDYWFESDTVLMVGSWNTDELAPEDVPRSHEELFTSFSGRIGVEATDWSWYYHIIHDYFVAEKGMTEEEAIDMLTEGLQGATIVQGHTLLATLLASGEFDYSPNAFAHSVLDLQEKGAPVTIGDTQFEGMPVFLSGHAMGIAEGAPHPATALLFAEFSMSEAGQAAIASIGNQALSQSYSGDTLIKTTFPDYIDLKIGVFGTEEQQQDWQDKYNDLLQSIGTGVRTN